MRRDSVFREALHRFLVKFFYKLIWLLFFLILILGIAFISKADYQPYDTLNPPSSNTFVTHWIDDNCDYVVWQSSEYNIMAVKGNLDYDGSAITGTDVLCLTYNSNYNNRSYVINSLSDFRLNADYTSLIYSNLADFADLRGGGKNVQTQILYCAVIGFSMLILFRMLHPIFAKR